MGLVSELGLLLFGLSGGVCVMTLQCCMRLYVYYTIWSFHIPSLVEKKCRKVYFFESMLRVQNVLLKCSCTY